MAAPSCLTGSASRRAGGAAAAAIRSATMREVRVRRDTGKRWRILPNDLDAAAEDIAALCKRRWAIELSLSLGQADPRNRRVKQTLKIRNSWAGENAVAIQRAVAPIAFMLPRMTQAGGRCSPARSCRSPGKRQPAASRTSRPPARRLARPGQSQSAGSPMEPKLNRTAVGLNRPKRRLRDALENRTRSATPLDPIMSIIPVRKRLTAAAPGLAIGGVILRRFRQRRRQLEVMLSRADHARDTRQWDLAVQLYRDALDCNPDIAPIWVQYGHALKEAGDLRDPDKLLEAELAYGRAITLAPDVADHHLQLGHALKLQGKPQDAQAAYPHAYELDPDLKGPLLKL